MRRLLTITLLFGLLLPGACAGGGGNDAPRSVRNAPISGARRWPLFELHSDPWVNLHQRLLAEATSNQYWHAPVGTCTCAMDADGKVLPVWAAAVAGYKADFTERNPVFDPSLVRTNLTLALAGTSLALPKTGVDAAVAKWIEGTFEPYMRGAWPADDARNKAWIATVEPLISKWGREIASELARRYGITWPERPIRVEVTQYAGFGGAYTTGDPILTTMSSEDAGYVGDAALEMLFHEASHGLDTNLTHDLQMAFLARGKREPRSLDHAIIFYTAGQLARRRLGPSYVPYAEKQGVYRRGWEKYEPALRAHWQPWLDDQIDMQTALDRLAANLE